MGNKISKFSCGLINKNGNKIIIANSKISSNKSISDKDTIKFNKKLYYNSNRNNSLIEKKINNIKTTFFIDDKDIDNLFSFYSKKLTKNKEFIVKQDLYDLCNIIELNDEICPYIEQFWENIIKSEENKVYFDELLIFLISYCICSNYQLIEFVFGLIDKDNDKFISYDEIINLISKKYNQKEIFKYNHLEQIIQYSSNKIKRKDKINIDDFLIICLDNPFIFYPAVKMQNLLKNNYIGKKFWKNLNKKITKNYTDSISKEEHSKLQNNIESIRNKVINERIKSFKEKWKQEEKEKKKNEIYKQHIRFGPMRKNSDSNFYIDKYILIEKNIENKVEILKLKREKKINEILSNDKKKYNEFLKSKSLIYFKKLKSIKSTPNININEKLQFFFMDY